MRFAHLVYCSLTVLALLVLGACSAVHIQSGPPTQEERVERSSQQGSDLRSEWANRLAGVSPLKKVDMVKDFMDSVTTRYIRFGRQVAQQWRDVADEQQREVSAEEMRRAVEAGTETDRPVLDAYDDMVDYGISEVRQDSYLDGNTENLLLEYRDLYDAVRGQVFIPNGTREAYEDNLYRIENELAKLSRHLEEDLQGYQ